MSNPDVRAAVATPALLGECPLWAPEEGLLYWLDIEGRVLHRYDPTAGTNETRGMPGRPGAAALGPNPGELIIAMEHELVRFSWDDPASLQPIRALEAARTGNRLNDGRTDPAGRFVVGSMWADPAAGKATGRDMNDPAMNVLMKKATNLASVLTTLMRSLRVFN